MDTITQKLSKNLRPIYEAELSLGNSVARVDEPAGTNSPLAIVFKAPLHKRDISAKIDIPAMVRWWESRDPHYEIEGGYICDETRHMVSGPLR